VTLRHNDVITNYAGSGGGLSFIFTNAVLKRNRIQRNEASNNGGGMRMEQTNADIWDTLVRYNHANSAGALYLSTLVNIEVTNTVVADNRASMGAAGIYGGGSSMRMIHTTVAANKGGDGTGIVAGFGFFSGPASLYMENSVVVSHAVGITVAEGTAFLTSTARLDGVLWYANGTNIDGGGDISVTHEHTGNPRFAPDGFHIRPGSYAIDRGVSTASTMDFDGQPRPFGPAPDLGVDEARIWWIYVPIVLRNS
jgi:hypothetical protein